MNPIVKTTASRLMMMVVCAIGIGADDPTHPISVRWSAKDLNGKEVRVPVDRTTILAFVRADHEQSRSAIAVIRELHDAARVLVVVSGPAANANAKKLADELPSDWSVVCDPDFSIAGNTNVHAWPTTILVRPDGIQVAHLAGVPPSFRADLAASLEFAAGKLDEAALKKQLAATDVVMEGPDGIAWRQLRMAERLLEQGDRTQARAELAQSNDPALLDPGLQLARARIFALLSQPSDAIALLDQIPAGAVPQWQLNVVRGRALICQEHWGDAMAALQDQAVSNPDPVESHYLLGLCYQHAQDWRHASDEFQQAFEKSAAAQATKASGP